jgi:hypothetical protein
MAKVKKSELFNLHSKISRSIANLNPRNNVNCESCYNMFKKLYEDIKKIEYKLSDSHYIKVVDTSLTSLSANLKGIVLNFIITFTKTPKIVDSSAEAFNIGDIKDDNIIIFDKGKIQKIALTDNEIPIALLQKVPLSYYNKLKDYVITVNDPLYKEIVKLIESQVYHNQVENVTLKFNDFIDQDNKKFIVKSNIYYKQTRIVGVLIEWSLDPDFEIYPSSTDVIELPITHPLSILISPITKQMQFLYLRIGLKDDKGFMLINLLYPTRSDWLDDTQEFFDSVDKINEEYDSD